jgi:hypothetical protein
MLNGRRQPSLGRTSRVNREVYARFCERLAVRFRGPTRQPAVRNFRGDGGNAGIIEARLAPPSYSTLANPLTFRTRNHPTSQNQRLQTIRAGFFESAVNATSSTSRAR